MSGASWKKAAGWAACFALVLSGCPDTPEQPGTTLDGIGSDGVSDSVGGDAVTPIELPPVDIPQGDDTPITPDDGPDPDVAAPDCDAAPYGSFCPCDEAGDCFSGFCLQTANGKQCAEFCVDSCPQGFSCQAVSGGGPDLFFVCVERTTWLCMPCTDNGDCQVTGFDGEDRCVSYGDAGSFCGVGCDGADDCPDGYDCDAGGQCVRSTGTCDCAPLHISLEAATACEISNAFGSCAGERQCGEIGLSVCDALEPVSEVCNGKDDNCSGVVDDIPQIECVVENEFGACPGTLLCNGGVGVCQGSAPSTDVCDGKDNDCNGTTDDGYPNNDKDTLADCVDPDDDNDGLVDEADNCPIHSNLDQLDTDGDLKGDACDTDDDNDKSPDTVDCEPLVAFIYPFAPEICDGVDNDCDGVTDEKSCNDQNPCTDDVCDPISGCDNPFNTAACNDGNPCTGGDQCSGGQCQGSFIDCDDGNPCTDDACDPAGGCTKTFNTLPCTDGNLCTSGDSCASGICLPGAPVACSDGNACTLNTCDKDAGCQLELLSKPCNDGNPCTTGDACQGGDCTGPQASCDDGDACTTDTCSPDVPGGCVNAPVSGVTCDDGLACTADDTCQQGACVGADAGCECTKDSDCDDDGDLCNGLTVCDTSSAPFTCKVDVDTVVKCALDPALNAACVAAGCDAQTGECFANPINNGGGCNDGDGCTTGDVCQAGSCAGSTADCDDKNPCTTDTCDAISGCISQVAAGFVSCDDGNACTEQDQCKSGFCVGNQPKDCDDGNPCTDDGCAPGSGCTHAANSAPCNDDSACTLQDTCSQGTCQGVAIPCDNGDPCDGVETCDAATGCQSGTPLVCNDGLDCTVDGCSSVTGCKFVPNHALCTSNDSCAVPQCNGEVGCITQAKLDGALCTDGNPCSVGDSCQSGVCQGEALVCSDGNPCTTDGCNPLQGCAFTAIPDGGVCSDDNPCTVVDTCLGGACIGKGAPNCDDENACTDDACVDGVGCESTNNVEECNDGDACTAFDLCSGGVCNGAPIDCSQAGDGDPCTENDACVDGSCVGTPKDCSAFDAQCTTGTCTGGECGATAKSGGCDDGDACTDNDVCQAGTCGGTSKDCSAFDKTCAAASCVQGECEPPAVACNAAGVQLHTPSACVSNEGASVDLRGSVGHGGPVGLSEGTGAVRVRFGFHSR